MSGDGQVESMRDGGPVSVPAEAQVTVEQPPEQPKKKKKKRVTRPIPAGKGKVRRYLARVEDGPSADC